MLLKEKKILFIHVPKTGGTTIGNIIHPDDYPLVISPYSVGRKYSDIKKGDRFHFGEHKPFDYYAQHAQQIGMNISSFFVFAFVRNPYSRLYSTWKFIKKQTDINNPIFEQYKCDIQNDFQSWIYLLPEMQPFSWCQKQSFFVKSNQCNFVGRYENFLLDLKKVLSMINMKCSHVPIFNKTSTTDEYKYHYNQKCRNIVYNLFQDDFIEFNYER